MPILIKIKLVPGNVVMVETDMVGKSPYWSRHTELRKSMTFLLFLFSFLIITFITSVIFLFPTIALPFAEILF